jgi:outer membrane protein assembly factor BamB
VFGDRIIYPATSALKVYSAKNGRLLKDINNTEFAIRSGGAGQGQFYYVSADYPSGGRLVALDLERNDSLPRWSLMVGSPMRSQPVHKDSITYYAGENGIVRAVNEQPASIWGLDDTYDGGFKAGGPVYADLTIDSGIVYVASLDTKLYALQQASGQIKWRYYAGVRLDDKPEVSADTVYIMVRGKGLVAISKSEGKDFREPKWANAEALQFLADDAQHSYVRLKDGKIAALDKATGKKKWTSARKDFTTYGTNPKDGQIYLTTSRGELLCVKAVTKVGVVGEVVMSEPAPMEIAAR